MFYQQGDVLIEQAPQVSGKKLEHLILAKGEITGHHHQIKEGNAELYEKDGIMYLKVIDDEVKVVHEEHGAVAIPKGNWKVRKVREYDHFEEEARNVRD